MSVAQNLVKATDRQPAIHDRRKKSVRRSGKERRRDNAALVGIDISQCGVTVAVIAQVGNGPRILTTDFVPFEYREDANSLVWNKDELTEIFQQLSEKHKLSGQAVSVSLGGQACVTRCLFGESHEVDAAGKEIMDRANYYLALGTGDKIFCKVEKMIDAKRKRAWMTVAERSVVESVAEAVDAAGMRLVRIEHTLIALCQIAGFTGCDMQEPVLLVATGCGRADLVITYQGQLILDYRPTRSKTGDTCSVDMWAETVCKRVKCLRRYLSSQLPREHSHLAKICLPGATWKLSGASHRLTRDQELTAIDLPLSALCDDVELCLGTEESSETISAIWMARSSELQSNSLVGNLAKSLKNESRITWTQVVKSTWPIAAALLLVCGLYVCGLKEKSRLNQLEESLESLQTVRLEHKKLSTDLEHQRLALQGFGTLHAKVPSRNWSQIVKACGRALPSSTWLKRIVMKSGGEISIYGASFADDAVYDYLSVMADSKLFEDVALKSTQSVRLASGPALEFEITARTVSFPDVPNSEDERIAVN
ncbi:MAG: PilN domain-containing protein [Planctomycetales bacterium]|nr:PilN domain-containing protein [Planctomycetales bacterium]